MHKIKAGKLLISRHAFFCSYLPFFKLSNIFFLSKCSAFFVKLIMYKHTSKCKYMHNIKTQDYKRVLIVFVCKLIRNIFACLNRLLLTRRHNTYIYVRFWTGFKQTSIILRVNIFEEFGKFLCKSFWSDKSCKLKRVFFSKVHPFQGLRATHGSVKVNDVCDMYAKVLHSSLLPRKQQNSPPLDPG